MAHFAEVATGVVSNILVVPDEQEHRGHEYLHYDIGLGGEWVQCSYNGKVRGGYPQIGAEYNRELDVFINPTGVPVTPREIPDKYKLTVDTLGGDND